MQLLPIEHSNQRILTTQQIAEFYGTDAQIITNNFTRNKHRYMEGKHYYRLEGEMLQQFLCTNQFDLLTNSVNNTNKIRTLYLWTEKGALMHAKSLNTDKAWEQYEILVDNYYRKNDQLTLAQAHVKELDIYIDGLTDLVMQQQKMRPVDFYEVSIVLRDFAETAKVVKRRANKLKTSQSYANDRQVDKIVEWMEELKKKAQRIDQIVTLNVDLNRKVERLFQQRRGVIETLREQMLEQTTGSLLQLPE